MEPPNKGSAAVQGTVTAATTSAAPNSSAGAGVVVQEGARVAMDVGVAGIVLGLREIVLRKTMVAHGDICTERWQSANKWNTDGGKTRSS
jgi:hypothetical protein